MDVRKEIFEKITTALDALGVYEWVDLNKGQLDNPKEHYPFGFPTAFVGISLRALDMNRDYKEGTAIIEVTLAFDKYGDTFVGAEDREASLQILDQVASTSKALHWLEGDNFGETTQTSETDLTQRYKRPVYRLNFETVVRYNLYD